MIETYNYFRYATITSFSSSLLLLKIIKFEVVMLFLDIFLRHILILLYNTAAFFIYIHFIY